MSFAELRTLLLSMASIDMLVLNYRTAAGWTAANVRPPKGNT